MFKVHVGGRRYRRFATLALAIAFCNLHFERTGVILGIVEVKS